MKNLQHKKLVSILENIKLHVYQKLYLKHVHVHSRSIYL